MNRHVSRAERVSARSLCAQISRVERFKPTSSPKIASVRFINTSPFFFLLRLFSRRSCIFFFATSPLIRSALCNCIYSLLCCLAMYESSHLAMGTALGTYRDSPLAALKKKQIDRVNACTAVRRIMSREIAARSAGTSRRERKLMQMWPRLFRAAKCKHNGNKFHVLASSRTHFAYNFVVSISLCNLSALCG